MEDKQVRKNKIVFTKSDFRDEAELYAAVSKQIELLIKSDCICVVYDDDMRGGYIVIEYNKLNEHEVIALPSWIYPDEEVFLRGYQDERELNESLKKVKELRLKKATIDTALDVLNNKNIKDEVYDDDDSETTEIKDDESLKNGGKGGNKA